MTNRNSRFVVGYSGLLQLLESQQTDGYPTRASSMCANCSAILVKSAMIKPNAIGVVCRRNCDWYSLPTAHFRQKFDPFAQFDTDKAQPGILIGKPDCKIADQCCNAQRQHDRFWVPDCDGRSCRLWFALRFFLFTQHQSKRLTLNSLIVESLLPPSPAANWAR